MIEGVYKISIEQSARYRVDGVVRTASRLITKMGSTLDANTLDQEPQIKQVIALYMHNEEAISKITLEIAAKQIIACSGEETSIYEIRDRVDHGNGRVTFDLDSEDLGQVIWEGQLLDARYFVFQSEDELSEYVWVKV